jgi:hypothetical protein
MNEESLGSVVQPVSNMRLSAETEGKASQIWRLMRAAFPKLVEMSFDWLNGHDQDVCCRNNH